MYFLYIHRWKNCQKTMEEKILTQPYLHRQSWNQRTPFLLLRTYCQSHQSPKHHSSSKLLQTSQVNVDERGHALPTQSRKLTLTPRPRNQCRNQLFTTREKGQRQPQLLKIQRGDRMFERQPTTCANNASSLKQPNMGMVAIQENLELTLSVRQLKENNTQVKRRG